MQSKSISAEFPRHFKPMLAKVADGPFDEKNWIFEIKWDGFRALAFINNGKIELLSRNLKSFNSRYPEVVKELEKINDDIVIDGEIVNLNSDGKTNFQALQDWQIYHRGNLQYQVFDILYAAGKDLSDLPLLERKKVLKQILPQNRIVRYCDHIEKNGIKFFNRIRDFGIEGAMAKNAEGKYLKGQRSNDWLKIKNFKSREVIIIGYTEPRRGRMYFGSLLVAVNKDKILYYIGHVGTGFNDMLLKSLYDRFKKIEIKKPPIKIEPKVSDTVHWIRPKLVCEIKYNEMTKENILRQPTFLRLREDINPSEVLL